jgi:hypothetical protein
MSSRSGENVHVKATARRLELQVTGGRGSPRIRSLLRAAAFAATIGLALNLGMTGILAFDDAKYPDWKGQWTRFGGGSWDPSRTGGARQQQAPLTPEYQAVLESGLAEMAAGGHGNNPTVTCRPPGMPRAMLPYESMEIIIEPEATHIAIEFMNQLRRIYTDGRDWPRSREPTFLGYSIGHWEDADEAGRFHTLVVETRGMKGPRTFHGSIPLHKDNETIVKERISADKGDPGVLHNEITTIDHALTRPWTVTRTYRRARQAIWFEYPCAEHNEHVFIGKENYYLSADGALMPARKNQPPPDLRYFDRPGN